MILDSPIITGSLVLSGSIILAPGGAGFSGSFSGSYQGNGSGLTDVPLSVVGILSGSGQIASEISGAFTPLNTGSLQSTTITGSLTVSGSGTLINIGVFDQRGNSEFVGDITASGAVSASNFHATGNSQLTGANILGTNGGGTAQTIYGNSTFTDNLTINGVFTANGNTILGNATSDTVTAQGNVSSSIVSTASFGTYLGDGSQLSGISAGFWSGSHDDSNAITRQGAVQITGSLKVGDSSANDQDFIVNGGSIEIKRQNNNILRDYTSPGFSSGGAVLFGYRAMGSSQGQNQTVAIGRDAGFAQLNSDYAVFMGYAAGGSSGTGDATRATIIGAEAGYNSKAAGNTLIGYRAGYNIADGIHNIIIGAYAASGSGDISGQLRIGSGSLDIISGSLDTGDILLRGNVSSSAVSTASFGHYIGDGSGLTGAGATDLDGLSDAQSTAQDLTLGQGAGNDMSTGTPTYNTYVGVNAGYDSDTDTTQNVAVGHSAMENNEAGSYQVAIGYQALNAGTTGHISNTAIGWRALKGTVGGAGNVAVGYNTMVTTNATGDYNVALGYEAMNAYYNNQYSIGIGYRAAWANRDNYSVAIGNQAGYGQYGSAGYNVYIGNQAAYKTDNATGSIAIGHKAAYDITDGHYDIAIGYLAAENLTTGDDNIILGRSAGDTLTTGTGNILLGPDIDVAANSDSGQLRIGSGSINTISGSLVTGDVTIYATASMGKFKMEAGATLGYVLTSDASGVGSWAASAGGGGAASNIPSFANSWFMG